MKHTRCLITLLILALLPFAASAEGASPPDYLGFAEVREDQTNLRKAPGGERIRYLFGGEVVYVADLKTDAAGVDWYLVYACSDRNLHRYESLGYVRGDMLRLFPELTAGAVDFDVDHWLALLMDDGSVRSYGPEASREIEFVDTAGWQDIIRVKAVRSRVLGITSAGSAVWAGHAFDQMQAVTGLADFASGRRDLAIDTQGRLHPELEFFETDPAIVEAIQALPPVRQASASQRGIGAIAEDGSVHRFGQNDYGECDIDERWDAITQIELGEYHTVGLLPDGTVLATGDNTFGQCNVSEWTNIQTLVTADYATFGIRTDGTIAVCGENGEWGKTTITGWQGIVKLRAGEQFVVGLTEQGGYVMARRGD